MDKFAAIVLAVIVIKKVLPLKIGVKICILFAMNTRHARAIIFAAQVSLTLVPSKFIKIMKSVITSKNNIKNFVTGLIFIFKGLGH